MGQTDKFQHRPLIKCQYCVIINLMILIIALWLCKKIPCSWHGVGEDDTEIFGGITLNGSGKINKKESKLSKCLHLANLSEGYPGFLCTIIT